jgi:PAS domain S-box-containing protein
MGCAEEGRINRVNPVAGSLDVGNSHGATNDASFKLIADSAPVPIWVTGLDRQRSFVNRAYVEFLGCSYADAVSFDWRSIIHPDDVQRVLEQSIDGEASLKPFTLVGRYFRGDGQWRWLSSISNPQWDAHGRHIGFIGVAHDVTESKNAEFALREREAQFSAFINQSTAGFAQVDLDGKFTLVNDRFCEISGWSREELLQRRMQDITHPDDLARNIPLFEAAVRDGTPYAHEKRYVRPDGSEVWINNSVAVIMREDGTPYGVLAVTLDVTSRRESEAALRRASQSMRLAIEGAGMATWELDLSTMEGPWSPNRFDILGYARTPDGRAAFSDWLARVHPQDRERAEQAAMKCFTEGTPFEIEYRILRADTKEVRWLRSSGTIIRANFGHEDRFVGVSFDITEKKNAEVRQQLLIDELNHRVKNTLAIVQSIAQQSAKSGSTQAEVQQAFEGRLAALSAAHNLLTTGLWQPTDMKEVIKACLAPLALTDQIEIDGPSVTVSTRTAITLALAMHEMATNAAKYGALSVPEGRAVVSWTISNARELTLRWAEINGPPVREPANRGFGLRMIEKGLAAEFGGRVEIAFIPAGFMCTLVAFIPEVTK